MRTTPSQPTKSTERSENTDALALLIADHQKVTDLFEQFESALESASSEQKSLSDQICDELEIHSTLEEEIFYPAVNQQISLQPLVEEALQEHAEVREAIQIIRNQRADDTQFGANMLQLMEDVERHVDEEENVLFPEVESRLGAELESIGFQLKSRKQELMASMPDRADDDSSIS
ncbi:MAG: hemerythrin domain-containing protein [Pseudomonadota bacterium]